MILKDKNGLKYCADGCPEQFYQDFKCVDACSAARNKLALIGTQMSCVSSCSEGDLGTNYLFEATHPTLPNHFVCQEACEYYAMARERELDLCTNSCGRMNYYY